MTKNYRKFPKIFGYFRTEVWFFLSSYHKSPVKLSKIPENFRTEFWIIDCNLPYRQSYCKLPIKLLKTTVSFQKFLEVLELNLQQVTVICGRYRKFPIKVHMISRNFNIEL